MSQSTMKHFMRSLRRIHPPLQVALVGAVLVALGALPSASAQTKKEYQALLQQIRLLKQDVKDLNLVVMGGKKINVPKVSEAPSSEEFISRAAANTEERFITLEDQIRSLTGSIERMEFENRSTKTRLDKLVSDIDFRLTSIEEKLTAAATLASQTDNRLTAEQASKQARAKVSEKTNADDILTDVEHIQRVISPNEAPSEKVLGTIPVVDTVKATAITPVAPAKSEETQTVLPEGSVLDRYNFAYKLVRQFRTDDAEVAFREFLSHHGDHSLADNARYWLGESYYARRDFPRAAATFVEAYGKSPAGPKARDNLLKLGMSLSRLNQKEDACASFDELLSTFTAEADVTSRKKAENEKKRAGCE